MRRLSEVGRAIAAGAAIPGFAGRALTAALAVSLGRAANLSCAGLVEATIVGAAAGAVGYLLLPVIRRRVDGRLRRGAAVGAILFFLSVLFAAARGGLGPHPALVPTLAVVAALYVAFGCVLDAIVVAAPAPRG